MRNLPTYSNTINPFGDSSLRTFTKKRYQYTGKEKDAESGLYYYGARYYAAWTCRFTSIDPLAGKYPSLNPYIYAFNNPLAFNDPTGMEGEKASASSSADNISTDGSGDSGNVDGGNGGDTTETDKGITLPEIEVHGEDLSEKVSPIDVFDQSDKLDNRDIQRPNDSQPIKKGDAFLDENGAGHIASFDEFIVEDMKVSKGVSNERSESSVEAQDKVEYSFKGLSPFKLKETTWFSAGEGVFLNYGRLEITGGNNSFEGFENETLTTENSSAIGWGIGLPLEIMSVTEGQIIFDKEVSGSNLAELFEKPLLISVQSVGAVLKYTRIDAYTGIDMQTKLFHVNLRGGGVSVATFSGSRSIVQFKNKNK